MGNGARQNDAKKDPKEDSWLKSLLWQRAPSAITMYLGREERWERWEDAGMREAKQTLTSGAPENPTKAQLCPGIPGQHCGGLVLGYLLVVKTQWVCSMGWEEMTSDKTSSALHLFLMQNSRGMSPHRVTKQ